jgi:glycosyltransferase involved in cell wall biosynthesis
VRWLAEAAAWRRFDREAMAGTVLALATTPESAEALRSIECHPPIEVVTNGVEVRPLRTPPYGSRDIAFVGWMGYEPNVQAVCWFVRTVWPEVRRAYPESRFRIVGRNPSPRVRALEGDGVVVTGEVPDVADACEGVRLGVVPLRAGMGVKNKTLELLAMGLPVVGTPVAAEGLSPGGEDGLIVAEDQRAMRDAVLRLMADDEDVKRLGAEARAFVERRFAWDAIGDRYVRSLERAASGGEV